MMQRGDPPRRAILEAVMLKSAIRPFWPVLLGALLVPATSPAADKDGNYAVWGMGAKSCFHFTQAQGKPEGEPFQDYVSGYLTAYDALTADTYSITAGKDLDQVMAWITDYCTKKQIHSFEQALAEFTVEYHPQRSRRPPFRFGR
jgi:hypothetical protein